MTELRVVDVCLLAVCRSTSGGASESCSRVQ